MSERDLERRFHSAMITIYERAKTQAGYNAVRFLQMVNELGGLDTAHMLLQTAGEAEGYTALWERKRLDLTMEAMIVETPEWHPLFSDKEIEIARRRLEDYGYSVKA